LKFLNDSDKYKTDSLLSSTQYCDSSKDLAFDHTF
jgi:hypothetical protein